MCVEKNQCKQYRSNITVDLRALDKKYDYVYFMFVGLHYNHDFVYLRYVKWFFFSDILAPHTNFNKSQPVFQGVSDTCTTGLTLSEE